jgi:hypothetical protein
MAYTIDSKRGIRLKGSRSSDDLRKAQRGDSGIHVDLSDLSISPSGEVVDSGSGGDSGNNQSNEE